MAESSLHRQVAELGRLILSFRLLALLVTVLYVSRGEDEVPAPILLSLVLLLAATSYLPLRYWDRVAPALMRHPALLAGDLALSVAILAVTGVDGPFLSYTVGTALLAGVLYGRVGAAVFSLLLVGGYVAVLALIVPLRATPLSFQAAVGAPALYPLAAAGTVAVRELLVRQHRTESELAVAAQSAAAAQERARLAREMHDSLTKTLHGVALSAEAVAGWVERQPDRAAAAARALARAAQTASGEARELIGDLRSDRLDAPLHVTVRSAVDEWAQRTGVTARVDADDVQEADAGTRYELFCILKECLRNIERHAGAEAVRVRLRAGQEAIALTVVDDGRGLRRPVDLDALAGDGHYGVVGMSERAQRVGGRLELWSEPDCGTTLRVTVPPRFDEGWGIVPRRAEAMG